MDRSILFIYANRFKDAQNRFYERVLVWRPKPVLRGGLGMGGFLRGSEMRCKMSWYGCGFMG